MKRYKRTFTTDERELVFDLWKQGSGFSDVGRIINAKPGSVFTILRESGGIKSAPKKRHNAHLIIAEREEIRLLLSAKHSLRSIAKKLGLSPSTISREVARNCGRRYYKAVDAYNRATRMAKRPKLSTLELNPVLRQLVIEKLELKWSPEQISGWLKVEHSQEKLNIVATQLNERPRKSLKFKTPSHKIVKECCGDHLNLQPPLWLK